jgi:hypothetical protein
MTLFHRALSAEFRAQGRIWAEAGPLGRGAAGGQVVNMYSDITYTLHNQAGL